ncbi:phosphomevalonate kinase [Sporosarcina contaminans]|uniref:phosphomevalonate kinase n=1 Tax=Sporosarcina contaminans TaxID=633403 RepID=A0ABW3TSR7_9BACL
MMTTGGIHSNSTYQPITIQVPGKLFIAGEFAVLEPEASAIVAAVNRYVYAEIAFSDENHLQLPNIGFEDIRWDVIEGKLHLYEQSPKLSFLQNTLQICNQYIVEAGIKLKPFTLRINSELDDASGRKYGLGSSAAVVVAAVTAILRLYKEEGISSSPEIIYKLASIVHFKTQGNGSCADVAASTYGGYLHYSAFDGEWIKDRLTEDINLHAFIAEQWPGLHIKKIVPPTELLLCVGWTGNEMSTYKMIEKIKRLKLVQPAAYADFLEQSIMAVHDMVDQFEKSDERGAIQSFARNRKALSKLGRDAEAEIETPKLQELIHIANKYGAGKTSGAGGGDCGIAFVIGELNASQLKEEWASSNIEPLNLAVSKEGAMEIRKADETSD